MSDVTIEAGTNGAAEPEAEAVPTGEADALRLRVAELEVELAAERLKTATEKHQAAIAARQKLQAELTTKFTDNGRFELFDGEQGLMRRLKT